MTPAFADDKPVSKKPKVEVVFCLDTTGSMGNLIEGAKAKIWAICNQIANGKPTPDLKVGLVAYRDKGDAYVTKVFELTDDLDAIHGHLKGFKADGGGDIPEHVNQALFDAVHLLTCQLPFAESVDYPSTSCARRTATKTCIPST